MMKIILTTLNAKFIHSSYALRSIESYCAEYKKNLKLMEFTINNHEDYILGELVKAEPDVICFSCYIWNIKMTLQLINTIKKILKRVIIVVGGPEVSFETFALMEENKNINIAVQGEGEETFRALLDYFILKNVVIQTIKGIVYRTADGLFTTDKRTPLNLDSIPFVYSNDELLKLKNRIIYYESQRGCPFSCIYCLSSNDSRVRELPLDRVYIELKFFLDNKIPQCKFVDRTFNQNIKRAVNIWQFIIDNDNNITNFHFEIAADILNTTAINTLSQARKGLFQFEIGIQSTNEKTLESIKRKTDFNKIKRNIINLNRLGNIHIHLDLIVGLPYEDYNSFCNSFNDTYNLQPDQLQIGFLKMLKGCEIRNKRFNIEYKQYPPYEVLSTKELSYQEIITIKIIEDLIEKYYNSNNAKITLKYIITFFELPFRLFERLSKYWIYNNYHSINHNKYSLYNILFDFCYIYLAKEIKVIRNLLKFDMLLNDNIKSLPNWANDSDKEQLKLRMNGKTKQYKNPKHYNISSFSFDIPKWLKNTDEPLDMTQTLILFDYTVKDEINRQSKYTNITQEIREYFPKRTEKECK